MVKPHIKYRVTLTGAERQTLHQLVKKGQGIPLATVYATPRYYSPWTRYRPMRIGQMNG
jgi:hypothetical protein